MIVAAVHSIRVSLVSHHRVVLLKDKESDRYLPIWIGPYEAEAIAMALQHVEPPRPMTHDLLKNVTDALGATVSHILINELTDNTFHARIVMDVDGRYSEIDSRPSDAMALAVRCKVPIYVADEVMEQASIGPSAEVELAPAQIEEDLATFRDFVNTLDLEDPPDEDS